MQNNVRLWFLSVSQAALYDCAEKKIGTFLIEEEKWEKVTKSETSQNSMGAPVVKLFSCFRTTNWNAQVVLCLSCDPQIAAQKLQCWTLPVHKIKVHETYCKSERKFWPVWELRVPSLARNSVLCYTDGPHVITPIAGICASGGQKRCWNKQALKNEFQLTRISLLCLEIFCDSRDYKNKIICSLHYKKARFPCGIPIGVL